MRFLDWLVDDAKWWAFWPIFLSLMLGPVLLMSVFVFSGLQDPETRTLSNIVFGMIWGLSIGRIAAERFM